MGEKIEDAGAARALQTPEEFMAATDARFKQMEAELGKLARRSPSMIEPGQLSWLRSSVAASSS